MNRYLAYYRRVLQHKYLFFKHGSKFGVSLWDRIIHNLDMLRPKIARLLAPELYDAHGQLLNNVDTSVGECGAYQSEHPFYVSYWLKHKWKIIPDRYLSIFITDRFIECGCDLKRVAIFNRDLFFSCDSDSEPRYSSQVASSLQEYRSRGVN